MKKLYQRKYFLNPLIFTFLAVILVTNVFAAEDPGEGGGGAVCGSVDPVTNNVRMGSCPSGKTCQPCPGSPYACYTCLDPVVSESEGGVGEPASFKLDLYPDLSNLYDLASGKSIESFVGILYRIALPIAVVIGMLMVGIAGIGLMTSEGDPSKTMNAKDQLTSAIIGLLFVMLGVGILRALISTLFTDTPQIGL